MRGGELVRDELNPYAVTLRYDLIDTEALDREHAKEIVEAVRQWTEKQIRNAGS